MKDISKFKEGDIVSTMCGESYKILRHVYIIDGRVRKGIHSICESMFNGEEVVITWNKSYGFNLVE